MSQAMLAEQHVEAGTIALGEEQLDAAENAEWLTNGRLPCPAGGGHCPGSPACCPGTGDMIGRNENPPQAEAEATARETEGWPIVTSGPNCSAWVDWIKTQYRLTDRALKLADDQPEVDERLKAVHEQVYRSMFNFVNDIGRACTEGRKP